MAIMPQVPMRRTMKIEPMTTNPKTVLVTGAFGGIGKAVCRELSLKGHTVLRVARQLPAGDPEPLPGPGAAFNIEADLARTGSAKRMLESAVSAAGKVDVLIHCAGTLIPGDVTSMGGDDLRKMIDDNLFSVMLACGAVLPAMTAARDGQIIILGSLGGIIPMPHGAVYCAAKFAVRGYTLSLAEELRESGVTVSLISCGPVHTRMLSTESRLSGSIAFVNRPLPAGKVAKIVLGVMDHPRRETVVPRFAGLLSPIVGAFSWAFEYLYPLVSAIGQARKMRYRTGASACPDIPGRQR